MKGDLYPISIFCTSSIERSIRLADGMLKMLESRNLICAEALLRMQIDMCLRIYAAFIVDDIDAFLDGYLKGQQPHNFKDDRGNKMTEGYLKNRLDEYDTHLPEIYNATSGSIHFSSEVLPTMGIAGEGYRVEFNIGREPNEKNNVDLLFCATMFCHYMQLHCDLLDKILDGTAANPTTTCTAPNNDFS